MDYAKLLHINGVWMRQADDARLTRDVMERLADRDGVDTGDLTRSRVLTLMPG